MNNHPADGRVTSGLTGAHTGEIESIDNICMRGAFLSRTFDGFGLLYGLSSTQYRVLRYRTTCGTERWLGWGRPEHEAVRNTRSWLSNRLDNLRGDLRLASPHTGARTIAGLSCDWGFSRHGWSSTGTGIGRRLGWYLGRHGGCTAGLLGWGVSGESRDAVRRVRDGWRVREGIRGGSMTVRLFRKCHGFVRRARRFGSRVSHAKRLMDRA
jgi:hypothetical protein